MAVHHYLAAIQLVTLPWACLTPCWIALICNNCSRQYADSSLCPSQTQAVRAIMTDFLCRARPLHCLHLPKDRVLWAALTMGHYGLFQSGELA